MSAVLDPSTDLASPRDAAVMPGFNNNANWELAQRVAKAFASSTLVPGAYQGNVANCIIALEMANRIGASPLMVMQSLFIVHGTPSWSSKFLIASFNQCGRFSALRYEFSADRGSCRAWAIEKATGERIDGPLVTIEMAKAEGWSTKSGSKWKTMPELMLMYRAAAFLIRTYAPEISMGLRTDDEIMDTVEEVRPVSSVQAVRAALAATKPPEDGPANENESLFTAYVRQVESATSAETATLVMDEARSVLNAEDMAEL